MMWQEPEPAGGFQYGRASGASMSDFADPDVSAAESPDRVSSGVARQGRRLSDKILVAFHHACDAQDLVVAEQLLKTLESMLTRRGVPHEQNRRKSPREPGRSTRAPLAPAPPQQQLE